VNSGNVNIGVVSRGDIVKMKYNHPTGYVRFVEAFLVNKKGQIWVPIRGLHKSVAPGGYDFSVAEHVLAGESNEQAIARGFAEEAGVTVMSDALVHLGTMPPADGKGFFNEVYVLYGYDDGDPTYSQEEFSGGVWMLPSELQAALVVKPSKMSLPLALDLLM
jgi:isopentenyldiphosphate isomerase